MGPRDALQIIYEATAPVLLIAALIGFFVRSVSEKAAATKIEKLGESLGKKIDDLKTTLGDINATLRVGEERHAALDARADRLERRVDQLEVALQRGV